MRKRKAKPLVRQRKLFCELSPLAYQLSTLRCRVVRSLQNVCSKGALAQTRQTVPLPYLIYQHNSLIRRKLGQVDPVLQENKAVNLRLAAPKVSGVLIRPGETFSFWTLVGPCTKKKRLSPGADHLQRTHLQRHWRRHVPVHQPDSLAGAPLPSHRH